MRLSLARRVLLAVVPALFLFSAVPGCSNQSEGERCADGFDGKSEPNSSNCGSGLVCIAGDQLQVDNGARCCLANGAVTDERCRRKTSGEVGAGGSSAGTGGDSGGGVSAGSGGANAGTGGDTGGSSSAGSAGSGGSDSGGSAGSAGTASVAGTAGAN